MKNDVAPKESEKDAQPPGLWTAEQIADAITTRDGHHPSQEAVRSRFGPYL